MACDNIDHKIFYDTVLALEPPSPVRVLPYLRPYVSVAVRQAKGHWCGYVGLPKSHPWYGVSAYDDILDHNLDVTKISDIVEVHGGITYASFHKPHGCEEPDLWWFGFDCGHAWDIVPLDNDWPSDGVYRNFEFVEDQLDKLVIQLELRGKLAPFYNPTFPGLIEEYKKLKNSIAAKRELDAQPLERP